jgi:hypothetical protein
MPQSENESKGEFRLLDKISVPKKRNFKVIKDRLPKNRFSVGKITSNNSFEVDKGK